MSKGTADAGRRPVVDNQRQRILVGAVKAAAEYGYPAMTVDHVLVNAGVSSTAFYETFDDKRDCILAAHEQAFNQLSAELMAACMGKSEWPAKVGAAIAAGIEFAIQAPEEAQLLIVEAMVTDPVLVERVLGSNDYLVGLLQSGRTQCERAARLPALTERALIGAVTSVVGSRLLPPRVDQLGDLKPQLVQFMLIPYVGIERARKVGESSA